MLTLIIGQKSTSRTEDIHDAIGEADVIYFDGAMAKSRKWWYVLYVFISNTFKVVGHFLSVQKRYDRVIGISHFPGFLGCLLKKLKLCKENIYYCIDYYQGNTWFINLENAVDRWTARNSTEVWDISSRITTARNIETLTKIVPLFYRKSFYRVKHGDRSLVFAGTIVESQGLELLCDYSVEVIGKGYYQNELKRIAPCFNFLGFLPTGEMLDYIARCGIGIALWKDERNAYYGDPGKTKLYITCGIPVIVSKCTVFSRTIEKYEAGITVNYDKREVVNAIRKILSNHDFYKQNAVELAKDLYAQNTIS